MSTVIDYILSHPDEPLSTYIKSLPTISPGGKMIGILGEIIVKNNNEMFDEFMKEEFDINEKNSDDTTVLMIAAYNGRVEMVEKLLKKGASITSDTTKSILHFALNNLSRCYKIKLSSVIKCVKVLMKNGADTTCCDLHKNMTCRTIIDLIKNQSSDNTEISVKKISTTIDYLVAYESGLLVDYLDREHHEMVLIVG